MIAQPMMLACPSPIASGIETVRPSSCARRNGVSAAPLPLELPALPLPPQPLHTVPQAQATLKRIQEIDTNYEQASIEHYLAVLDTIRPPALGGDFESGLEHFERAISLSGGYDLSILVDFARYYARTLYERELHDQLLQEVLAADPVHPGYTLFNTLAQAQAQELLDSADDYF